jgi:hypothetical protein
MLPINVPDDFTSTLTYQNSNYSFPHESILSLPVSKLTILLFDSSYILPDYIAYHVGNNNKNDIMNRLKLNKDFVILGVSFMKFKGLEEKWDNLMGVSLEWKMSHTHNKFQELINLYINENPEYEIKINYITTILQLIMINIINYLIDYDDFPDWMNLYEFNDIINMFNQFINLNMITIPVSTTIYVARTIPLINELYTVLNDFII